MTRNMIALLLALALLAALPVPVGAQDELPTPPWTMADLDLMFADEVSFMAWEDGAGRAKYGELEMIIIFCIAGELCDGPLAPPPAPVEYNPTMEAFFEDNVNITWDPAFAHGMATLGELTISVCEKGLCPPPAGTINICDPNLLPSEPGSCGPQPEPTPTPTPEPCIPGEYPENGGCPIEEDPPISEISSPKTYLPYLAK